MLGIQKTNTQDSDGDGVPNVADIDEDNDGIYGTGAPRVNGDRSIVGASYQIHEDVHSNGFSDFLVVPIDPLPVI